MKKLKPCPFCGNADVKLVGGPGQNPAGEYFVVCGCDRMSSSREKTIKKWNTRAHFFKSCNKVEVNK